MRTLVVDDEPLARRRLSSQVHDLGIGEVVGEADNGTKALEMVAACRPDVVLLDVRMPEMDGLEAARHMRRLPSPPAVVFTTAYDDHALAAFETQALDYLLKPVRSERLHGALKRAELLVAGRKLLEWDPQTAVGRRQHISAVVGGSLRLLPVRDVLYLQADQGYVSAVSADTRLLIEDSLRSLEDEFGDFFVRIHRGALVQPGHVRGLEKDSSGNTVAVFDACPDRLVVSRRLLGQVRKRLRDG